MRAPESRPADVADPAGAAPDLPDDSMPARLARLGTASGEDDAGGTSDAGERLGSYTWTADGQRSRVATVERATGADLTPLTQPGPVADPEDLRGNIENYIGLTQVPTGVIGPVRVAGSAARGDFYVPLATTEGALVASFNRGAKATREAGGITSVCLAEEVQRAPVFQFGSLPAVGAFLQWVSGQRARFDEVVRQTSRYARLTDVGMRVEGNNATLVFGYTCGDAAGQNMVTLCTDRICAYILAECPERPRRFFVEGNYSGDKKATALSLAHVRGKKVTAEAHLPRGVVEGTLATTAEKLRQYWVTAATGIAQSGALGLQGHIANGLAALYLACGQDVACVAESAVGITRYEPTGDGGVYIAVTLPALTVGTVGGGTRFATQAACLDVLGCRGAGHARKFAEICAAVVLCGELSISAALASGQFARAHAAFGRRAARGA